MLDIKLIREQPDVVRNNLARRNDPALLQTLDALIAADTDWRGLLQENDRLKHDRNLISSQINEAKKQQKPLDALLAKAKELPQQIKQNDARLLELEGTIQDSLYQLPNLLDDSVPVGKDESENVPLRSWGKAEKPAFPLLHHGELAVLLNGADFEHAVSVAGTGFFYLLGDLALLDLAIQRFAIDLLIKKGFVLVQPPLMMNRRSYEAVAPLGDFESVMYKIENENLYLVATSEHPLVARFLGHTFKETDLPLCFAGVSPCFRKEIGKHGLDERGFFRVHQFNKIEQIVFCRPEESNRFFDLILENSEDFLKKLKIPYRVVNVCTGDMGIMAAKKCDVDGWSPREGKYIELMSCSNVKDFQARRLNAKYFDSKGEKVLVHTLNNTLVATTRFLRILIENCQTKQGTIKIPALLVPYMNGKKEISLAERAPKKPFKKAANPKKKKR